MEDKKYSFANQPEMIDEFVCEMCFEYQAVEYDKINDKRYCQSCWFKYSI